MGIFTYKEDTAFLQRNLKCKICGKIITGKIKKKYDVCNDCVLSAKLLFRKKPEYEAKQKIMIITVFGLLSLLALINILAAVKNCMVPAFILTGSVILLGFIFLGLALE